MRRVCLAALACAGVLAGLGQPALAKLPPGVSVDVECGLGGLIRLGRVNPVRVSLKNNSKDLNLSGDLVLEYDGVEYATRLELPTPSAKQVFLYFPCRNYSPALTLRVRTKAYTEEFALSEPQSFRTIAAEDTCVLVVTNTPGCLGTLNNVSAARLYRNLYQYEQAEIGAGFVRPSYVRLEHADPTPKYFAQADMVVLAGLDYRQVTPELSEALKAAASGGTSVVFSLGLNGQAVSSSPLQELCPLEATATVQVNDLGSFGERYGFHAPPAATLATGRVKPGAKVLASCAGQPVIVQKGWGAGTATAFAFDLAAEPFKQEAGLERMIRDSVLPVDANLSARLWFLHPGFQTRPLAFLAQAKPMTPAFVLLFLAGYVALIGPLNFLLLDRFKRRTLVWTTIPLIIAAFSYAGLNSGYLYRGADNVLATVQEIHIYPDAAYAPYQSASLIFTATGGTYTLDISDRSAVVYPDAIAIPDAFGMNTRNPSRIGGLRGRIDSTEAPAISASQGKWASRTLVYQGFARLAARVSSDLVLSRPSNSERIVEGSFSLDLPVDLYNCTLLAGRHSQRLGYLPRQGTYGAQSPQAERPLPVDNYLTAHSGELLQQMAGSAQLAQDYTGEALLVGFTTELPVTARLPLRHLDYSLSMLVVHLPCRESLDVSGPASIARSILVGGSGFLAEQDPYAYGFPGAGGTTVRRYLLQKDSYITVQYRISGAVDSRSRLSIHLQATDPAREAAVDDPARTVQIDLWTANGWQELRIPLGDPSVYLPLSGLLDAERCVTLRFKALQEIRLDWPQAEIY